MTWVSNVCVFLFLLFRQTECDMNSLVGSLGDQEMTTVY